MRGARLPSAQRSALAAALACAGAGAGAPRTDADPFTLPERQLEPVNWTDLDGWAADDHARRLRGLPDELPAVPRAPSASRDTRPVYARR